MLTIPEDALLLNRKRIPQPAWTRINNTKFLENTGEKR